MTDAAQIAALEERMAKLEAAATLFETTRQEWEKFSKSWNELGEKLRLDEENRKREVAGSKTRSKNLWAELDRDGLARRQEPLDQAMELLAIRDEDRHFRREIQRNFGDLQRAVASLTEEIRKLNAPDASN
jgi:hypothetical protein